MGRRGDKSLLYNIIHVVPVSWLGPSTIDDMETAAAESRNIRYRGMSRHTVPSFAYVISYLFPCITEIGYSQELTRRNICAPRS